MSKRISMIGKKFNKLTVLSLKGKAKDYHLIYKCKCDCGNFHTVSGSLLRRGESKECSLCAIKIGKNNPCWRGHEEISKSFYNSYYDNAKRRNIKFSLKIKDLWDLFLKQERRCALTGIELNFRSRIDTYDGTASLDRIDSSKGYILSNVQWVHKDVNYMKQDLSQKDFIRLCYLICKKNPII